MATHLPGTMSPVSPLEAHFTRPWKTLLDLFLLKQKFSTHTLNTEEHKYLGVTHARVFSIVFLSRVCYGLIPPPLWFLHLQCVWRFQRGPVDQARCVSRQLSSFQMCRVCVDWPCHNTRVLIDQPCRNCLCTACTAQTTRFHHFGI